MVYGPAAPCKHVNTCAWNMLCKLINPNCVQETAQQHESIRQVPQPTSSAQPSTPAGMGFLNGIPCACTDVVLYPPPSPCIPSAAAQTLGRQLLVLFATATGTAMLPGWQTALKCQP